MKKFEFHLEKLLSYKDQMLDSEMMTLGLLQSQLNRAQNKLSALEMELAQSKKKLEDAMMGNVDPTACQIHKNYIEHMKELVAIGEKEVEQLKLKVNEQIELVKGLKLDTKSLENIKSSRFEEYQKEDLKISERQLEEFINTSKMMKISV